MRSRHGLHVVGGLAVLTLFFVAVFAGTSFLTSLIYQHLGRQPSHFLAQTIDSFLGLFLGILILAGVSLAIASRREVWYRGAIAPIIEALEGIARGDFSVRVDDRIRDNRFVGGLAESVNSMALELSRMEQMRQDFISDVSHEIQSPLTSIRGFAQALRDDGLGLEDRRRYLAIIETESTRLSRLTDNLLRLASLDSEQTKFEPRPFRLDKQIRNLILACEPQWTAKELDLDIALDEATITADEDLLSQVWTNLIHNSIKFTPNGGSVRIELRRRDDAVEFAIADTGIGISQEDQAHVFERFYKADKSRERSKEGSGLGLSIAKKIVELHKGAIGLKSKPGTGTTFTVQLPLEPLPASGTAPVYTQFTNSRYDHDT